MGRTDRTGEGVAAITTPIVGEEASTKMYGEEISTGALGEHDGGVASSDPFGAF